MRAQTGRIRHEIDRNHGAIFSLITILVPGAEAFTAASTAQAPNAGEAVIVEQNNVKLDVLLQGCGDLLSHHEIRAVAHQHVNFPAGIRHFYPKAAGDLVAHAGVTVLQVVALGVVSAPEFMQIPGKTACGAYDHFARTENRIQQPNHFSLAKRWALPPAVNPVYFGGPLAAKTRYLRAVVFRYAIGPKRS